MIMPTVNQLKVKRHMLYFQNQKTKVLPQSTVMIPLKGQSAIELNASDININFKIDSHIPNLATEIQSFKIIINTICPRSMARKCCHVTRYKN